MDESVVSVISEMNAAISAEMRAKLDAMKRLQSSRQYQSWLADYRARWKARPWYERAWIVTKSRVSVWRITVGIAVGEFIAGQRLSDY
jgi:hypothetical protein